MNDRFDFPEDARADLAAFKQRLERHDSAEKEGGAPAAASGRRPRKSLWDRIQFFLSSLIHLSRSRRRLAALEDETATLRGIVEGEFAALARATNVMLAKTNERFERLSSDAASAREREREAVESRIDDINRLLRVERMTRQKAFSDFDRRLTLAATRKTLEASAAPVDAKSSETSLQSLLETFYFLLEERYRGAREEIKQRLFVYANDFQAARERTGLTGPIVDIGCGRGELLEMLREEGFQAVGVDSNDTQLDAARRHGVAVIHADALAYLRTLENDSVLAVAGIHVAEHIPFPDLVLLMQEVARVLRKGGVAIFETPNPRNLIVGATTFHLDPTHIRPLPAEVLQILLETVGFDEIEQRPLHPSDTLEYMVKHHDLDRHVATLLFGPQDYAVIGQMR